ncbi:hypothetical protein [Chroococcidiopsis cubana]|uniref:hypothetical protein n=1 Tax=Chroococcidiopsis cubana TaxID=171392 RepID=UPI0013151D39|nr:hypothetical protein [Chroococcidiopsis cubana]
MFLQELIFKFNNTLIENKRNLAATEDTSAEILQQLSQDKDPTIRALVASNPNTPTQVLLELGIEFPDEITRNPIFLLETLENSDSEFVRISLARSTTTPTNTLKKLALDRSKEIRRIVAANPSTPVETLEFLLGDPYTFNDKCLRYYVATNPNITEKLLAILAFDPNKRVRIAVANHPQTSSKTLNRQDLRSWIKNETGSR